MPANSYLIERAREVLTSRPDLLRVFDESVVTACELTPPEVKVLAACVIAGAEGADSAIELAGEAGVKRLAAEFAVDSLEKKGLLRLEDRTIDLAPLARLLRVEVAEEAPKVEGRPEQQLVFRPLREQVVAIARSDPHPVRGLAAAYCFVFGRSIRGPNSGKIYGALGKIVNALGTDKAALFFLEYATYVFAGEPVYELLPHALQRAKPYRPADAPDEAEQRRELATMADNAWRARMRRWLAEGGEIHALVGIDQAEEGTKLGYCTPGLSSHQAEADRRQVKLDFAEWRRRGETAV